MLIIDRVVLGLTGLVALFVIIALIKKQKVTPLGANIYFIVSFAVLLVSGGLLIVLGWGILSNKFVKIVATLIPFALAVGLVFKVYPKAGMGYLVVLLGGLSAIVATQLIDVKTAAKIIYPSFHALAGLTIVFVPIFAIASGKVKPSFICVSIGGVLISAGGMALAFLTAGKQLLFFSPDVVMMILAPLLFLTGLFFGIGLLKNS